MTFGAQKDFQNLFALSGFLEPFLFQMLEKDFFFLLHYVFLIEFRVLTQPNTRNDSSIAPKLLAMVAPLSEIC